MQAAGDQRRQIGEGRVCQARLLQQIVDHAQHLNPPAARGNGAFDAAAIEDRADAIAVPRQQARHRRDEIDQHGALQVLRLHRAEIHRGTEIEQKPRRDFAIFGVLPDVGRVHAGRDVPIDVANIVFGLIFAQIGKVYAVAVKQAAIIALQQAVQTANDLPVETLQDALRR